MKKITLITASAALMTVASSLNAATFTAEFVKGWEASAAYADPAAAQQTWVTAGTEGLSSATLSGLGTVDAGALKNRSTFGSPVIDKNGAATTTGWLAFKQTDQSPTPTTQGTNRYYQFSFAAAPDYSLALSNISFDWQAAINNNATTIIFKYDVWVSVNGGGFVLATTPTSTKTITGVATGTVFGGNATHETVSLTGLSGIDYSAATTVDVRISPWGDKGVNGSGVAFFQNIAIDGSTTAIPEPSTYALGAGVIAIGAALAVRRRRKA